MVGCLLLSETMHHSRAEADDVKRLKLLYLYIYVIFRCIIILYMLYYVVLSCKYLYHTVSLKNKATAALAGFLRFLAQAAT